MATSLASPVSSESFPTQERNKPHGSAVVLVTALTLVAFMVHGYHPYAEDGGVYMPEIKRMVDPTLYPHGSAFVVGHLPHSLFAPAIAGLARLSHWSVETILLLAYLASFWMTLLAASLLAARCYRSRKAKCGALMLLTVWMTLPIAGTSLMLMDPYVTARSIATPFALLALVGALDFLLTHPIDYERRIKGLTLCCASLAVAVAMHPLMGAYSIGSVLLLVALMWPGRTVPFWGIGTISLATLATAIGVILSAPVESATYKQVVLTRYYWFVEQWHWYEIIGLLAPLLILAFVALRKQGEVVAARSGLTRMAIAAGLLAGVIALLFARPGMDTHAVARLQPLRIFQLVYIVMILELGAAMAERLLRRRIWLWIAAFSLLAIIMIGAERITFAGSRHFEITFGIDGSRVIEKKNPWEAAFAWIRKNTPRDATFAMDAMYISQPGEDAQGFRALSERNALPDFSKDGGIVTNKPQLADLWLNGQHAQTGLGAESDSRRIAALKPLGVTWVVLQQDAKTQFVCNYENAAVKVCQLP